MNFFKRGLTSIFRRPGKTLILLALVFVLSNVIAGAVSVKGALANTKTAMINSMGAVVKVQIYLTDDDYKDINFVYPSITKDMVEKIAASEYVKSYDYSLAYQLQAKNIANYSSDSEPGTDIGIGFPGGGSGATDGYFTYKGGQSTVIGDFSTGNLTLKEGRTYTEEEIKNGARVLLVSDKVAEKNNLTIGSRVKCIYSMYNGGIIYREVIIDDKIIGGGDNGMTTYEYEFEVIGIFSAKPVKVVDMTGKIEEKDNPNLNTFFTTNNAISGIIDELTAEIENSGSYWWIPSANSTAMFTLTNPEVIEIFETQNKPHLMRGLIFVNNSGSFDSIISPMTNVEWIADIVMWVAVAAAVVIISLLVTLFLRDRRHEMGIYLALGERKGFVALQILSEVLLIAVIAVSLSIFSGNIIAKEMSATMLENQLKSEEKTQISGISGFNDESGYRVTLAVDDPALSTEDIMDMYQVKLEGKNIAFIYVISMGSMLVSTLIPIFYTLQLKPKKILM